MSVLLRNRRNRRTVVTKSREELDRSSGGGAGRVQSAAAPPPTARWVEEPAGKVRSTSTALTAIIAPYEGDAPRHHTGAWRRPFEAGPNGFGPLAVTHFDYVHRGPPDQVVVDRFLSVSFIAALPEAERDRVAARLRALCRDHPALRGRETVDFPYRTEAWVCRREG